MADKCNLVILIMVLISIMVAALMFGYMIGQYRVKDHVAFNLTVECQKVPWKYKPPVRPSCDTMASMRAKELVTLQ